MKFRFYRPSFVDGVELPDFEFKTFKELLDYRDSIFPHSKDGKGFYQYSLTPEPLSGYFTLMKEFDHGEEFWVLGFIYGNGEEIKSLNLPTWLPPSKEIIEKS